MATTAASEGAPRPSRVPSLTSPTPLVVVLSLLAALFLALSVVRLVTDGGTTSMFGVVFWGTIFISQVALWRLRRAGLSGTEDRHDPRVRATMGGLGVLWAVLGGLMVVVAAQDGNGAAVAAGVVGGLFGLVVAGLAAVDPRSPGEGHR